MDSASVNAPRGPGSEGVERRRRVPPVLSPRRQVGKQHRREGPADAQAGHVDDLRPGDVRDDVQRGTGAVNQVVVEGHVPHGLVGVAVADREDGMAVLLGPLDEAASGGQVHQVVLVDPRRGDEQRDLVDRLGLGFVLDQLHELVAENHLAGRGGQVAAHLEGARVHLAGPTAVVHHVVDEVLEPAHNAHSVRFGGLAQRGRIRHQEVGGRHGVHQQPQREGCLVFAVLVETPGGHQLVDQVGPGEVGLPLAEEPGVLVPGGVSEAAVLGGGEQRRLGLGAERPRRHAGGGAGQAPGEPHARLPDPHRVRGHRRSQAHEGGTDRQGVLAGDEVRLGPEGLGGGPPAVGPAVGLLGGPAVGLRVGPGPAVRLRFEVRRLSGASGPAGLRGRHGFLSAPAAPSPGGAR